MAASDGTFTVSVTWRWLWPRMRSTDRPSEAHGAADCASDPHFRARGSVQEVDDPLVGRTLHPGPVIRLDGDTPESVVGWPGPAAGAHTEYVLQTLLGEPKKSA